MERTTVQTNSQRSLKSLIVKILSFRPFFFPHSLLVTQRKFHSSLCNLWLPFKSWARAPKRTLTRTLMKDIVCRICHNIAYYLSAKPKITFRTLCHFLLITSPASTTCIPQGIKHPKQSQVGNTARFPMHFNTNINLNPNLSYPSWKESMGTWNRNPYFLSCSLTLTVAMFSDLSLLFFPSKRVQHFCRQLSLVYTCKKIPNLETLKGHDDYPDIQHLYNTYALYFIFHFIYFIKQSRNYTRSRLRFCTFFEMNEI